MSVTLIAFTIGILIARPILRLLIAAKSRQNVSVYAPEGHQVKQGTPTMGGLIPIGVCLLMFVLFVERSWPMMLLFFGFALIGFLDDYIVPRMIPGSRGLSWMPKLALQMVVALGTGYAWLGPTQWSWICAFVFIVLFAANAYNFSDGLDGLAGGLGVILLFTLFGALAFLTSYYRDLVPVGPFLVDSAAFPFVVIGGLIAFLFYNAPPAKVFMGDVGSLSIGAVIGFGVFHWIQMFSTENAGYLTTAQLIGWLATIVLCGVLIVELAPVPLQILSVKLRKGKRLFSYTPIHHAFERKGIPETRVTAAFLLTQVVLAVAALAILSMWSYR